MIQVRIFTQYPVGSHLCAVPCKYTKSKRQCAACFSTRKTIQSIQMNAETLRLLLAGILVAMYVLAILYLRRQPSTFSHYMLWGLFALLVPALGPFLVILLQPGKSAQRKTNPFYRR